MSVNRLYRSAVSRNRGPPRPTTNAAAAAGDSDGRCVDVEAGLGRGALTMADQLGCGPSDLEEGSVFRPKFGADGLAACVTIDAARGEILMVAHMNQAALQATLETGFVHY